MCFRAKVEADVCEEKMLGKAKYKVSNLLQKSDLLTNTKIKLKESGPNTTLDVTMALKVGALFAFFSRFQASMVGSALTFT